MFVVFYRNVRTFETYNKLFPQILAFWFILRLIKRSSHYVPKIIDSHYGTEARAEVRKIEKVVCKIEKRKADAEFIKICILYQIFPKFLRFKLYNKRRQFRII